MQAALRGARDADVPCAGCSACCRSAQFVPVGPDEVDTLAHVPAELLLPAPGRPPGHLILGYDGQGRCPLLVNEACSIYAHRPRACRMYDCRVFTAAGIDPDRDDLAKAPIAARTRQWRFRFPRATDRTLAAAVGAAAGDLPRHHERRHPDRPPLGATEAAVLAIEIHDAYLARDATGAPAGVVAPDPGSVALTPRRRRRAEEPA